MNVKLEPGSTEQINVFLGTGMSEDDIARSLRHSRGADFIEKSYKALIKE